MPTKPKNKDRREREYLSMGEVEKIIDSARRVGRHRHRDVTMILVTYIHGLRLSELITLRWSQVDLKHGLLHVKRRKNGVDSTHPLTGREIRYLRKLKRDYTDTQFVFVSERKGPLTDSAFQKIISRAGELAKIGFPIHPHMLRHSTGYKLAGDGRDTRSIQHYLGHKDIRNTVIYTQLSPNRFNGFWDD